MTRADIKTSVRDNLDEADLNFFTDQNLNDSIQDGYNSTALLTGAIEKTVSINLQNNLVYYDFLSLIPDYYAVTKIYNPTTKKWLISSSRVEMDAVRENWEVWNSSQPLFFFPINFRYIAIIPSAVIATGTLLVYYRAQASTIANDSNPIDLPRYGNTVIEHYATKDLLEQSLEIDKAMLWYGHEIDDLKLMKRHIGGRTFPDKIYVRELP